MKKPLDPPRLGPHRLKLASAIALSLFIFCWQVWDTYGSTRAKMRAPLIAHMQKVNQEILRLDEGMSRSVHMFAITGDATWETHYLRYAPRQRRLIQEILNWDPDGEGPKRAIDMAGTAHDALVALDTRAFELVRQGKSADARELLTGEEYEVQRKIYLEDIAEFERELLRAGDLLDEELEKDLLWSAITTTTAVTLLILGFWLAFRRARHWQTSILTANQELNLKTAELARLNHQLESKVGQRTQELKNSFLASLNMMEDAVVARTRVESTNTSMRQEIQQRLQAEQALLEANAGLEHKVAERTADLRTAKERAEESDRLKSQFLANMSHEFRTPLNAIIGFTGTLLMRLPGELNPAQQEHLTIVQTSARHLLSLINDLLDLGKIDSGRLDLRPVSVACLEMVRDAVASLRPLATAKNLVLQLQLPPEEVWVTTDRRAFSQILLNLCNNAIKFTDTGSVTVAVAKTRGEHGRLIEVSVTDTGIGIKPEGRDRLFQAYTQMDSTAREGTGLGLHLSQKLARLLQGDIGFQSEYGHGSRFWLTLPLE